MDLEAPVDAWYVWFGVSAASVVIAGVVLGLPTGPPPDASGAANSVDRIAGSPYTASTVHEHDAAELRLQEGTTIELRNEHGRAHSSLAYGTVVLITDDDRLENVTYGTAFTDEFESELERADVDATAEFLGRINESHETTDGEWYPAGERLVVRTVTAQPDDATTKPRVTAEVTEGLMGESTTFATGVRFDYDGEGSKRADVSVEGQEYGSPEIVERGESTWFRDGNDSTTLSLEPLESVAIPLTLTADFDDGVTCEATGISEFGEEIVLCEGTDPEDPDQIADETTQITADESAGEYRVTLVVAE
ncbi:DUF7283 family protein [Natrarchaeobius chitinivorans]|uniref:Uncharacterized protein n=1 Tax=Natrarchaeobius chitinivorans TaxID=1679083 RepID=A0A3N6M7C7_NATCH|nr:hypothetical protein [Natrarchaeobius chitinivorans]RQG96544.1 hypothetical protein EA473_05375 [Natrarchaeobius chitinivorans]